jgi:hypothetical protein
VLILSSGVANIFTPEQGHDIVFRCALYPALELTLLRSLVRRDAMKTTFNVVFNE